MSFNKTSSLRILKPSPSPRDLSSNVEKKIFLSFLVTFVNFKTCATEAKFHPKIPPPHISSSLWSTPYLLPPPSPHSSLMMEMMMKERKKKHTENKKIAALLLLHSGLTPFPKFYSFFLENIILLILLIRLLPTPPKT